MSNMFKTIAAGALLAASLAFGPAVYAEQGPNTGSPHMGTGMPHGGMMGMPGGMMDQMSRMMEGCNAMMESMNRPPNSRFHKPSETQQQEE